MDSIASTTSIEKKDDQSQEKKLEIEKNKYLFREKCFLCKKLNPNPLDFTSSSSSSASSSASSSDNSDNENNNNIYIKNTFKKLTKLPLWMCHECKIRCKEEEDNKFHLEKVN
jgi:hypothetical protein